MEAASDLTSVDASDQQHSASRSDEPVQADNVGALLCATRMRMAGDLQAIAKILRIRYSYLVAIEDGRYEDLPGSAYSVGFVRAYADYLGLDGNEVVKRLREETNGSVTKTRFEFPLPSGESGLPNGGLLAIAVAMGVIVYGAWYTMTNADRDAVDLIQEMPSRIAVLIEEEAEQPVAERRDPEQVSTSVPIGENVAATDAGIQAQETVDAIQDVQALSESDTVKIDAVDDSIPLPVVAGIGESVEPDRLEGQLEVASEANIEAEARQEALSADQEAGVDVELAVASRSSPAEEVASENEDQPEISQSGVTADGVEVEVVIAENVAEPSISLPTDTEIPEVAGGVMVSPESSGVEEEPLTTDVATENQDELTNEAQPEQIAELSQESEPESVIAPEPTESAISSTIEAKQVIELRAKSDSWIQVRDGNELLLTRLLREGEVYQVPDRSGLTLMTGNAGGLEVFVGGELMPALGDVGVVRRGVPLSPERLRAGTTPG